MGKRSTGFVRRKHDDYRTPLRAVIPLIPHLPEGEFTFVEPCAGDYRLARHIEDLRSDSTCVGAWDIEPKNSLVAHGDALLIHKWPTADLICTNPPWSRPILHPMIEHFSAIAPTWLLFDADWMHTKQAGPYLPYLRKIVSVGRVKWIEDSKMSGKDNCQWHLFDQSTQGEPTFTGVPA